MKVFRMKYQIVDAALLVLAIGGAGICSTAIPGVELLRRPPQGDDNRAVVMDLVFHPGNLRAAGLQFDVAVSGGSGPTMAVGPAAAMSNKTLAISDIGGNSKRALLFGLNRDYLGDGTIAVISIGTDETAADGVLIIRLTSIVAVDEAAAPTNIPSAEFKALLGARLAPGRAASGPSAVRSPVYATMFCAADVNGDGRVDVADLQSLASMAAGERSGRCDLNGDGIVNEIDYRLMLNALVDALAQNSGLKH